MEKKNYIEHAVPTRLTGKEFEAIIMEAGERHEKAGEMLIERFGTKVIMNDKREWIPIPSFPDFDCAMSNGRQVVIEAKVVNAGRLLDLQKSKVKPSQVRYMLRRARFSVPCFFAIHFGARELKKSSTPSSCFLFPVLPSDKRWEDFLRDKHGAGISPEEAEEVGVPIVWETHGAYRKPLPDIRRAVKRLMHRFE